jgi:hypothetical protein
MNICATALPGKFSHLVEALKILAQEALQRNLSVELTIWSMLAIFTSGAIASPTHS